MFDRKAVIISILLCHMTIALAKIGKKRSDSVVEKLPELTEDDFAFAKKFYKFFEDKPKTEKKVDVRQDKDLKASSYRPKVQMTGGQKFLDDLFYPLFPVGDKYAGIPDSGMAMAKYCYNFVIRGLAVVAYGTIRWPHKFLQKAIFATGTVSFLGANLAYCLSPASISNYIAKAKIANRNHDEMVKVNEEMKIRAANSADKIVDAREMQKHTCCAWLEYKRKMVEATPDEAKEFIASYYAAFFKLPQVIYCQQYQDGSPECENVQFIDDEPVRQLPRHVFTLLTWVMNKFF